MKTIIKFEFLGENGKIEFSLQISNQHEEKLASLKKTHIDHHISVEGTPWRVEYITTEKNAEMEITTIGLTKA